MINVSQLVSFLLVIPKCYIEAPDDAGCQFIRDREGNLVGEIHWGLGHLTIYEDYKYSSDVIASIERNTGDKFNVFNRDHIDQSATEIIKSIQKKQGETINEDAGKALYQPPENHVEKPLSAPIPHSIGTDPEDGAPF